MTTPTPRLPLDPIAAPGVDPVSSPAPIGRRTFLVGALVGGVLAACSSDESPDADGTTPPPTAADGGDPPNVDDVPVAPEFSGESSALEANTFTVVQRFPSDVAVPGPVRLPLSLSRNAEFINDGPVQLGAQVVDIDGNPIGERLVATRRSVAPFAYYVWTPTIDAAGIYALVIDGGPPEGASFQVFDREDVAIPVPGDILAGFDTPTFDAPGDVDPICTRDPNCSFHSLTLAEALNVDRGVAYFVGTPAFCQTGSCTPALEALVEVAPEFADDYVVVHAEVYTDLTATAVTGAVEALELNYEPALFITNRAGEVVDRLDGLWDITELRERLSAARS